MARRSNTPKNASPGTTKGKKLKRKASGRTWCFRILALIGAPTLFLGITEGVLRVAEYGYPASFLVADESDPSMVRDNYKFAWRFFPPALARTPQPIRVTRKKQVDAVRIVVFGGSAAMGDPEPAYGFPRMLEILLAARFPNRKFEVINAAVTTVNSHVVLPIATDTSGIEADLWVIYMGNNEITGPYGQASVFGAQAPPRWTIRSGLAVRRTRTGQWLSQLI